MLQEAAAATARKSHQQGALAAPPSDKHGIVHVRLISLYTFRFRKNSHQTSASSVAQSRTLHFPHGCALRSVHQISWSYGPQPATFVQGQ